MSFAVRSLGGRVVSVVKAEAQNMKETIRAVSITLKVADTTVLLILLSADGTVNRTGTGTVNNSEHDIFIGCTQDRLFEQFMAEVDEGIFQHTGRYTYPDPKGHLCTLTLSFQVPRNAQGRDYIGFEFVYGSESEGPNQQINQMVRAAVHLTDPWYEKQKQMVKQDQDEPPNNALHLTPVAGFSRFIERLLRRR